MSVRHTASELAKSASRYGLRFKSFTLSSKGKWASEDADWNYKDVPHLNHVHTQADAIPAAIGDDFIATINLQKIARVPMPIALANYVASDGSQVYYTTLAVFVLIVETRISGPEPDDRRSIHSTVETTYHIGGPRVAMWLFPLLRRTLTANYRVLMSEDLPMREQRGRLREAGYRFASDGRDRTFSETTDLTVKYVVRPPSQEGHPVTVDLDYFNSEGATMVLGKAPGGLRLVRGATDEISIYERVCDHEGACLDAATVSREALICPWHAKRIKPVGKVLLGLSSPQHFTIRPGCDIEINGNSLSVTGLS